MNQCSVVEPRGVLYQLGEFIPYFFDSGAECSLLKEKLVDKFKGKRLNNIVLISGIGDGSVTCTMQILSTVKICEFSIEILFHVVMDKYLKYGVLIGREILGQGFGVSIDANKFALYKTNTVNALSSIVELDFMDTINNDVDLSQSDKAKLAEVICANLYKGYTN